MSESEAVVVRVEDDLAYIEVRSDVSACGSCGDKGHCGKSQAGPRQYAVHNTVGAAAGDVVVVSVPDGAVLRAAALTYLMPLVFLLAGAVLLPFVPRREPAGNANLRPRVGGDDGFCNLPGNLATGTAAKRHQYATA